MARKGHKVKGSKVMRRSAHHKATGKYVRQRTRTEARKAARRLLQG